MLDLIQLVPDYRAYVWGGARLRHADQPIGEAWIVHENNRVASGPHAGRALAEVAHLERERLLGSDVFARTGTRFPLLIKLLDCHQWLSVQVHPNDAQAEAMFGPGHFGKTEAWHVIDAAPGATLISGTAPGTTREALVNAIRDGTILSVARMREVAAGDTLSVPAGTLHALGPGLLVYEVQQTSEITFRVWDWDRPKSAGRVLHIEQSIAVTDPDLTGQLVPAAPLAAGTETELVSNRYFRLSMAPLDGHAVECDTHWRSFHAVTVIEGGATVRTRDSSVDLRAFGTVLVPAAVGAYRIEPTALGRALIASAAPVALRA